MLKFAAKFYVYIITYTFLSSVINLDKMRILEKIVQKIPIQEIKSANVLFCMFYNYKWFWKTPFIL